jgi:hypothetical protein
VPRTFEDYREMLDSGEHDIVMVATPDHWHALPAIAAMKAGADVYLEKPVSVDVIEGEALVAAARKYGRVVQVNTQRRSNPLYLEARDKYITQRQAGKIGLVETYSYLGSEGWTAGSDDPDAPVPAHLNYDLWTGPAPLLPFKAIKEDRGWRAFMEYGNGPDRQPGRAHARPGALAAGPRLAGIHLLLRRDLCREGVLLQYSRHPAQRVPLPRPRRQLAAPPLGRLADPPAPLERPVG